MEPNFYKFLKKHILKFDNILITTHVIPDADGIGSQLALHEALTSIGKSVLCVNEEALDQRYEYLNSNKAILSLEEYLGLKKKFTPELIIIIDTNKISRTGIKMKQFLTMFSSMIFIDHHPFEKPIEGKHYIDTKAAATGQIIGHLLKDMKIPYTPTMARALYTAILIDTNTFRYPSVTDKTHLLIADLLKTGMKTTDAYNDIYGTKKLCNMHLLGHILKNCQTNKSHNIAWIEIHKSDLEKFNSTVEDTHSYINNLLILENVKVACMFREDGRIIRLSMRSHGDVDVAEIAEELGGGGHAHSAATAFEIPPGFDKNEIIKNSLIKIEEFLKQQIN